MKISRDQFLEEVRASAPLLELWARESVKLISSIIETEIGPERFKGFFKVDPKFRLKTETSALKKFDQWDSLESASEMHDLVGARFVVLLRTDLQVVEDAIKSFSGWNTTSVRHFEDDVNDDPEIFDYQSIHLVIRGNKNSTINEHTLENDVACEIQIRTIMQHAYAELCHDKIYKNFSQIPSRAKRLVARSMALMETTDSIFCETAKLLEEVSSNRNTWLEYLSKVHCDAIKRHGTSPDLVSAVIFDRFQHLLENISPSDVGATIEDSYIRSKITSRLSNNLFNSAGCVLTYWLVTNHFIETRRLWPDEALLPGLQLICSDLGISCD